MSRHAQGTELNPQHCHRDEKANDLHDKVRGFIQRQGSLFNKVITDRSREKQNQVPEV